MSSGDFATQGSTATTRGSKRTLIAVVRRMVFAGLTILGVWLVLLGLRSAAVHSIISLGVFDPPGVVTPEDFRGHWSASWWTNKSVSELVVQRIGPPLQLVGYGALMALGIAAVLLFLGVLFSRATKSPPWLARVRTVVRLVLVNAAVSNPFVLGIVPVMVGALAFFGIVPAASNASSHGITLGDVFLVSLLPAWLLVQAGHREMGRVNGSRGQVMKHMAVTLVIRLLRLTGAIIAVAVLVTGTLLNSVYQRDFPVVFAFAFVLAVIVVVAKLAADIVEIAYRRRARMMDAAQSEPDVAWRPAIPTGWVVFSLAMVAVFVLAAFIGPLLAPYPVNQVSIADKLAPPSAAHLLGTDNVGRDMLSRVLVALRTDVFSGLLAVVIVIGVAAGWVILSSLARKRNDWLGDTLEDVVMLPRDVLGAFPWLVLLMVVVSIAGVGDTITLVLAVSIALWPHVVGMLRECYLSAPGKRGWVENLLGGVLPVSLLATGAGILYMVALGYLGMGVPPPQPELGSILSGQGRVYLVQAPWIAQWPIIVLAALLFVWVMAGNALLEKLGFHSGAVWAKSLE